MERYYTIGIGTDHRGFTLKQELIAQPFIGSYQIAWRDFGTHSDARCDYPPIACSVAHALQEGAIQLGILLCGMGHGMAIAANRYPKIYAAVCWDEQSVLSAKKDDNCNILVIPADIISKEVLHTLTVLWLETNFKGGIYQQRLASIDQ